MAEPIVPRVSEGMHHKAVIVNLLRTSLDVEMNAALRSAFEICVLNEHEDLSEEILLCGIFMHGRAFLLKLLADRERMDDLFQELCPKQPPILDEETISKLFLDRTQPEEGEISKILDGRKQLDDRSAKSVPWVQLGDNVTLLLWEAIKIAAIDGQKAGYRDVLRAMTIHEDLLDRLYQQRGLRFQGIARLLNQS